MSIPATSSRRDAMRIAHWSLTRFMKTVQFEALQAAVNSYRTNASKEALASACKTVATEATDRSNAANLGFEVLPKPISDQVILERVEKYYNATIEK